MRRVFYRKLFLFCVSVTILCWIIISEFSSKEIVIKCWGKEKNCGGNTKESKFIRPQSEDSVRISGRFIMFMEGYGSTILNPRMLCSIESAAKVHYDQDILLFVNSDKILLTHVLKQILNSYSIKIIRLNVDVLFESSPLYHWYKNKLWERSYWPKSHFNDALRWLLLWKYGGVYLDLDVLVCKDLLHLGEFAGLESDKYVGAGALSFSPRHLVVKESLEKFAKEFDGTVWGAYGPELLTAVLEDKCGLHLPSPATPKCADFTVLLPEAFYIIPWQQWKKYIDEDTQQNPLSLILDERVLGLHTWNHLSNFYPIVVHSNTLYSIAAHQLCPVTIYSVDDVF